MKTVIEMALEALEIEDMACRYEKEPTPEHITKAITALREALAEQPAQQNIRNATLDEIATKIEAMPFGDTAASFAVWIREQKT